MRIADVAMLYGERSGGIRTYIEAKSRWAKATPGVDQHLVAPGRRRRTEGNRHELPSIRYAASNGYRLPLGGAELRETVETIDPDVVILHDPFWTPRQTAHAAQASGALVVAAFHTSVALNAAGLPGSAVLWRRSLRRWYQHAYRDVDAVMSVVDPRADTGRSAAMPLRLGLDAAFRPRPDVAPGDHALFVGRLSREKGLGELLEAAAGADWPLLVHGAGPWESGVRQRVRELGLGERVRFGPFISDREELARAFAAAACVVMPGPHETFGLVALEAAACGTPVVVADTAPSARLLGGLGHAFRAFDAEDLTRAVAAALCAPRSAPEAAGIARRHSWDAAFAAELADLRRLLGAARPADAHGRRAA